MMKRVLFVCIHNSGRSQMAEAFIRELAAGRVQAESAGTQPGGALNPAAVQVMAERGIDISRQRPKEITEAMVRQADRVITMGCIDADACPAFIHGAEDWGLSDPQGKPIAEVRRIRDEIEAKVRALLDDLESC